jgi:hypothetical protein
MLDNHHHWPDLFRLSTNTRTPYTTNIYNNSLGKRTETP